MKPNQAMRLVGSVFRLRRDLLLPIKNVVLPGSELTAEEADLLIDLYGARELGWVDPKANQEGYVTFSDLKKSLVHSQALLSRRISELESAGLLETKKTKEGFKKAGAKEIDGKSKSARITASGIRKVMPVFEKYVELCETLLRDISNEDQQVFLSVSEKLMKKLRWRSE